MLGCEICLRPFPGKLAGTSPQPGWPIPQPRMAPAKCPVAPTSSQAAKENFGRESQWIWAKSTARNHPDSVDAPAVETYQQEAVARDAPWH